VPVVSAPQTPEAMDVIRRVARMRGAPLTVTPRVNSLVVAQSRLQADMIYQTPGEFGGKGPIPLLGAHQLINANVAVTALRVASELDLPVNDEAIRQGLATVKWPGRLEVLSRDPLIVVDGAHNGDSAQKLAAALREVFHIDQWTLIIGISADKDIVAIFDALLPVTTQAIVTRARNTRAADIEDLAQQVTNRGKGPITTTSVADAIELALTQQAPIIITGSLFTVADAREAWFARIGQPIEKD